MIDLTRRVAAPNSLLPPGDLQTLRASMSCVATFRMLLLAVAGVCFWRSMPADMADDVRSAAMPRAQATLVRPLSRPAAPELLTRPIEEIQVGQRVLAHNPEVSQEERESWSEPDLSQWQQVSLEMPKPDGSLLKIEMLRPVEWLETQGAVVVESREIIAHPGPVGRAEGSELRAEGSDATVARLSEPGPQETTAAALGTSHDQRECFTTLNHTFYPVRR